MRCARNERHRRPPAGRVSPWLLLPAGALLFGFVIGSLLVVSRARAADPIERQAEEFVMLALSLGRAPHAGEVDAYFGPPRLAEAARANVIGQDALRSRAQVLLAGLQAGQLQDPSPRRARLATQVRSFAALLETVEQPRARSFDAEARAVYGLASEVSDAVRQRTIVRRLDGLLPGAQPLAQRVAAYQARFVVPEARRRAVFERALAECRARTLAHWTLPADERLDVEWTRQVDAAWHRYEGGHRSRLQINPAAVALPGEAIDVACHEGYPGHHAQFVLMDAAAGAQGLPVEDTVVLLRSPASVLREGAANYGVDLAFPLDARIAFERDVLFPLAGLDPTEAARYVEVHHLVGELSLSTVAILRDYRDGRLPADDAAAQLEATALVTSPRALLGFVDQFGAYAIGYTVARDAVRDAVAARGRDAGVEPWTALRDLLVQPDVAAL
ncbi:MAG: hypothetical protein QM661_16035, partial [Solimonas sp.]